MKPKTFRIKAVLFDFDGTLTHPGALDFPAIKNAMGCPVDRPLLEFIDTLSGNSERKRAHRMLEAFEAHAAAESVPNEGAEDVIRFLKGMDLKIGILSRNSRRSILRSLENFKGSAPSDFDVILTREEAVPPKPSPESVILAAQKLSVTPGEILMVGDFIFDVEAGNRAGAWTVLLKNGDPPDPHDPRSDFTISCLTELCAIARLGIPLAPGKLPNAMLKAFLESLPREDPSVLLYPGVGEDVAVVEGSGRNHIVLKSDPITFVTESPGRYAVAVNANDIAASGAVPRWFLTTLLFPPGTVPWEIREVMKELAEAARECGIAIVGGHTEITGAVTRPVVTGMMTGILSRDRFKDKRNMETGDKILFTKSVAVEGTSIIAREFPDRLRKLGMPESRVQRCRDLIFHISILKEAAIASAYRGVHAMHDVTEGGLATAVRELSIAGGRRLCIEMDRIPVYPETETLCRAMGLNPLGLIGSGSLLIACSPEESNVLEKALASAGIPVACIGEVMSSGSGVDARKDGVSVPWPHVERDELTRL